jgi:hypothetical protein
MQITVLTKAVYKRSEPLESQVVCRQPSKLGSLVNSLRKDCNLHWNLEAPHNRSHLSLKRWDLSHLGITKCRDLSLHVDPWHGTC